MDRVEKFIDEFATALDLQRRHAESADLIRSAIREAARLAESLTRLSEAGESPRSVTPADLSSLEAELSPLDNPPALAPLITNGRALLQVVEDGIVDGDGSRLSQLLSDATAFSGARHRDRSGDTTHLPVPVTVRCLDCDRLVVGNRQPAVNWNAITKAVRDHQRDQHGGHSTDLRDQLSEALRALRSGASSVTAGHYEIRQS